MSASDGHAPGEHPSCEHSRPTGCVYCPTCGVRYPIEQQHRGCLGLLTAPLELIANIYTPTSLTPDLDVTASLEAIRSGDPERTRKALGFLLELAPDARKIRSAIEDLRDNADRDIALRARDVVAVMDAL
ncbi:MAG: hypothetical protein ACI89X_002339 [Planctomycetota bacterium]|jgi:hypothetical protein